jgi:molybdopterin-guanine dinucleotide biosynthesis protein A
MDDAAPAPPSDTAVVILAGGEGRRIGGGKPLRRLAGAMLIEHALRQAMPLSPIVAISVKDRDQLGAISSVPLLMDGQGDGQGEGPIAGIAAALAFARSQGLSFVLTIPCDTPLLPPDLLTRLSEALGPAHGAAVATSGAKLHPSCALWRSRTAEALPAYLASGRSSLKGFAAQVGMVEVEWPASPFDPFFNVNSVDDLAAAEARIRSR